jgi:hypothetical protein
MLARFVAVSGNSKAAVSLLKRSPFATKIQPIYSWDYDNEMRALSWGVVYSYHAYRIICTDLQCTWLGLYCQCE